MRKDYTLSEKYRYFCAMSRSGAKRNGKPLSDFERGRYFERALIIKENAISFKKGKSLNSLDDKKMNKELDKNERNYSAEYLSCLYNNGDFLFDNGMGGNS